MSYSRVQTFLGIDISHFQSGLDKASGLAARFKSLMKIGGLGSLGGLVGSAALVQAFRSTYERAQQARDAAEKLNRTVNAGTAAVARNADAWDNLKNAVGDTLLGVLSFFSKAGEGWGALAAKMIRPQGQSDAQLRRTMAIGEAADRNAARLSTPEALEAAAARGAQKRAADAREDEQRMREVAREMNSAAERRETVRREALPLAQQLVELERERAALQRQFADSSQSALARARAFGALSRTEEEIARKRVEQEREIAEQKRKQEAAQEKVTQATRRTEDAYESLVQAQSALGTARRDAVAPSLADVAAGRRGASGDRALAAQILRDEARAQRMYESGHRVSVLDSPAGRPREVGWEYFRDRAAAARESSRFQSADQRPFAAAERAVDQAGKELSSAAAELKAAAAELREVEVEVAVD